LFFNDSNQNIDGNGNPDLRFNRIVRCTIQRFDAQVLFNPFEKEFYLPPAAEQFGDCYGWQ